MLPPSAARVLDTLGDLLPSVQPLKIRTMKETCIKFFGPREQVNHSQDSGETRTVILQARSFTRKPESLVDCSPQIF
jgi:hypothetical protein